MSFAKQIADAQAHLRQCWRVKSLRPVLFPEWEDLRREEKKLIERLRVVREQRKAIERRWSARRSEGRGA